MAGTSDNFCFTFVLLGIKHVMLDSCLLQHLGNFFRDINGYSTYQNRLPLGIQFLDLLNNGPIFGHLVLINDIGIILADHIHMSRNNDHSEIINLRELRCLCICGTCHSGKLVIHTKIILKSNGRQGLVLFLYLNPFLRFQRLVQSITIAAPFHCPASELVNNDNLTILNKVVNITMKDKMSFEGLIDMVQLVYAFRIIQIICIQEFFAKRDPIICKHNLSVFLIEGKMFLSFKMTHNTADFEIQICRNVGGTGNNKRGPGFID